MKSQLSLLKRKKPRLLFVRQVVGDSMLPTLRSGAVVVGAAFLRPRIGDIVVASVGSREVIKRVTGVDDDKIVLQGDNPHASTDSRHYGSVEYEAVIGRIIFHS